MDAFHTFNRMDLLTGLVQFWGDIWPLQVTTLLLFRLNFWLLEGWKKRIRHGMEFRLKNTT